MVIDEIIYQYVSVKSLEMSVSSVIENEEMGGEFSIILDDEILSIYNGHYHIGIPSKYIVGRNQSLKIKNFVAKAFCGFKKGNMKDFDIVMNKIEIFMESEDFKTWSILQVLKVFCT